MGITAQEALLGQSSLSINRSNIYIFTSESFREAVREAAETTQPSTKESRRAARESTLAARTAWADGKYGNVSRWEVAAMAQTLENYLDREIDEEEMEFLAEQLGYTRIQMEQLDQMMRGEGVVLLLASDGLSGNPDIYGAEPQFVDQEEMETVTVWRDRYEMEQRQRKARSKGA